jgi:hypothetical protein
VTVLTTSDREVANGGDKEAQASSLRHQGAKVMQINKRFPNGLVISVITGNRDIEKDIIIIVGVVASYYLLYLTFAILSIDELLSNSFQTCAIPLGLVKRIFIAACSSSASSTIEQRTSFISVRYEPRS